MSERVRCAQCVFTKLDDEHEQKEICEYQARRFSGFWLEIAFISRIRNFKYLYLEGGAGMCIFY